MEITPRLLPLAVAFAFVIASPFVAASQSPSQSKPASQGGRSAQPSQAQAPAPQAPPPAPAPATKPVTAGQPSRPQTPAGSPAPEAKPTAPAPQAAAAKAPTPTAPAGPQLEPQGYTYDPQGRRDPFISLLRRGSAAQRVAGARPAGLGGLETSEVTLKGTVASQGGFVAILQGADNKTYIVKPGDKLLDGTVRTITQDSMVISQQVNDPLSLEKQREVRKVLRQTEEAK